MKISKTREVRTPERGTSMSAGIDFFVPKFDDKFVADFRDRNSGVILSKDKIVLEPHQRALIPSGIKVNFEGEPKVLIYFNKSGVSTKKGLDVLACVIDQDYMEEANISIVNTSDSIVFIQEGEKIVQMIMFPIVYEEIEVVEEKELWKTSTERGEGGFGSTNK